MPRSLLSWQSSSQPRPVSITHLTLTGWLLAGLMLLAGGCGGGETDQGEDQAQQFVPADDEDASSSTADADAAGERSSTFDLGGDGADAGVPLADRPAGTPLTGNEPVAPRGAADNPGFNLPGSPGGLAGANSGSPESSGTGAGAAPSKPPSISGDSLDESSYQVPLNAGKNELIAFINRMNQMMTETRSAKDEMKIQRARIAAAEQLFTPEMDEMTRMAAIRVKATALQRLVDLGDPAALSELKEYTDVLVRDPARPIAAFGQLFQLGSLMRDYIEEKGVTYEQVRQKFRNSVTEYNEQPDMYMLSQNLINSLYQLDRRDEAQDLLQIATEAFLESENPQLQNAGTQMQDQLKMMQLKFDDLCTAVFNREENAANQLVETARRLVGSSQITPLLFSEVLQGARLLEMMGDFEQARAVYGMLESAGEGHPNPQLVHISKLAPTSAYQRMSLLGKPVEITGQRLDGESFDWSSYRGKHVLVFFWATRWPESLVHFPDYARVVQEYGPKGVAVLGINLDESKEPVQQLRSQAKMAWPNLIPTDGEYRGIQAPMAKQCGVDSAPFSLLVDPAGNVVALHLYQEELFRTLNDQLGIPNPEPNEDAAAEAPAQAPQDNGQN